METTIVKYFADPDLKVIGGVLGKSPAEPGGLLNHWIMEGPHPAPSHRGFGEKHLSSLLVSRITKIVVKFRPIGL